MINFRFSYTIYTICSINTVLFPFYNVHFIFRSSARPTIQSSNHSSVSIHGVAAVETTISIVNLCVFFPFVLFVFYIILSFASSSPSSVVVVVIIVAIVTILRVVCICSYVSLWFTTSLLCVYIAHR